jgi:hypothetical protein
MVKVLREAGFRVVIYLDDHMPGHVHIYGDGEAKINLAGAGGAPQLVWAASMTAGEIRKAMRLISAHQTILLKKWSEIHG